MTLMDALHSLPTEEEVPASVRSRVLERVTLTLAASTVITSFPRQPPKVSHIEALRRDTATGLGTVGRLSLIVLGSAVVGAAMAFTVPSFLQRLHEPAATGSLPSNVVVNAPVVTVTPPVTTAPPVSAQSLGQPPTEPFAPKARARNVRVAPTNEAMTLKAERQLLDDARSRAATGNISSALQRIEEHSKRFTRGKLIEEREALAITLLVKSGAVEQAKQRAQAFRLTYPSSFMLPAIDAAMLPD